MNELSAVSLQRWIPIYIGMEGAVVHSIPTKVGIQNISISALGPVLHRNGRGCCAFHTDESRYLEYKYIGTGSCFTSEWNKVRY